MLLTKTNATSRLEGGFVPTVGPSQPPDSPLSGSHSSHETMGNGGAPYPGIKHHKTDKSIAGGDVIIGGYVMACLVVVLLYIRVTARTDDVQS
ncbi:hypothetical protein SSX86_032825 [Deinandra increscens subsp. villosa]|uniref:Uncharacterized protein n=1 Tax=Deinandra increscens subsp. villosa TaxID=3103831 RepID=A0AAP0C6C5_9ASTR